MQQCQWLFGYDAGASIKHPDARYGTVSEAYLRLPDDSSHMEKFGNGSLAKLSKRLISECER